MIEYYPDLEIDEILIYASTWMDLKNIMLSKVSQKCLGHLLIEKMACFLLSKITYQCHMSLLI
jgi:hypothetical protein